MSLLESVSMLAGDGTPVSIACITMGGIKVPVRVAEVRVVDFVSWSGTISVAGAVAADIPANAARKGGEVRAPLGNQGTITLTIRKADATTFVKVLEPGSAFSLTVNPGFVLCNEVAISGSFVSDTFEAVEYV